MINDYAHRHTHDLYHGNDFSLDFLRSAGFNAKHTSSGGLLIQGEGENDAAEEREWGYGKNLEKFADTVGEASVILLIRGDDMIAGLSGCLLKYFAVAIGFANGYRGPLLGCIGQEKAGGLVRS